MSQTPARLALTITETAAALAVSPRTVRRLLASGALEPLRIGRAVRISTASLDHWITANSATRVTLKPPWCPPPSTGRGNPWIGSAKTRGRVGGYRSPLDAPAICPMLR